jgi:hypothetical protein
VEPSLYKVKITIYYVNLSLFDAMSVCHFKMSSYEYIMWNHLYIESTIYDVKVSYIMSDVHFSVYYVEPSLYRVKIPVYYEERSLYRVKIPVYYEESSLYRVKIPVYYEERSLYRVKIPVYYVKPSLYRVKIPVYYVEPSLYRVKIPVYYEEPSGEVSLTDSILNTQQ